MGGLGPHEVGFWRSRWGAGLLAVCVLRHGFMHGGHAERGGHRRHGGPSEKD
jgi:hypothetical protein